MPGRPLRPAIWAPADLDRRRVGLGPTAHDFAPHRAERASQPSHPNLPLSHAVPGPAGLGDGRGDRGARPDALGA